MCVTSKQWFLKSGLEDGGDMKVRPCTINSDDPLLFGCSLLGEYERCRRELLGEVQDPNS